jgi:succinate-semialdehyde dehydrogenase/glutarate-semialdehyde dehydrogenase
MDSIEVRNPATGNIVGTVREDGPDDVARAVSGAREALPNWQQKSFSERAKIVARFHDLILKNRKEVLDTIQAETGKTRRDALAELLTVAGTARYYLVHGERHLSPKRHRAAVPGITSAETIYKPHGVVGLITPWNYPFLLGIADALPALLAGNAVITKPSELTPLSAALGRRFLIDSGMDERLVVMVHGDGSIGRELIKHVDYVGFTGGTATGRKVALAAAERLIPYSLELGGKNPMIVLDGASLDSAATGLIAGAFSNSGQTCISVERIYVEQSIYSAFVEKVREKVSRLRLGYSTDWMMDMGSLISEAHAAKVLGQIEAAKAAGASVITGGGARSDLGTAFIEPTVLAGVTDSMSIAREETFGPVVSVYPVSNADEAVSRANDSVYGLNASIWAKEAGTARAIARRIETGSAGVNSTLLIYNSFDVPMGGIKLSGIGRRHGEHGILRYVHTQSIVECPAMGGGYDALAIGAKNQRMADWLVRMVKWWRRIPGIR